MRRYNANLSGSGLATMDTLETLKSNIEYDDDAPPAPKLRPQNKLLDTSEAEIASTVSITSLPTSTFDAENSYFLTTK